MYLYCVGIGLALRTRHLYGKLTFREGEEFHASLGWPLQHQAIRCIIAKFTDEQYTTINQSTAGHFNPRVFVNCLQVEKCCERRLFIWLQSGDVTKTCVNKVNTMIGYDTKTEVTLVEGVIIKA